MFVRPDVDSLLPSDCISRWAALPPAMRFRLLWLAKVLQRWLKLMLNVQKKSAPSAYSLGADCVVNVSYLN